RSKLHDFARPFVAEPPQRQGHRPLRAHRNVAAANAAAMDTHHHFARSRPRIVHVVDGDGPSGSVEHGGAHVGQPNVLIGLLPSQFSAALRNSPNPMSATGLTVISSVRNPSVFTVSM